MDQSLHVVCLPCGRTKVSSLFDINSTNRFAPQFNLETLVPMRKPVRNSEINVGSIAPTLDFPGVPTRSSFWMFAVDPICKLLLGGRINIQKPFVSAVGISAIHLPARQGFVDRLLFVLSSDISDSAILKEAFHTYFLGRCLCWPARKSKELTQLLLGK
jgi:hypothetical protein